MRFITRPLPAVWPSGTRTPVHERHRSSFRATRGQTMELLERELRLLGVEEPVVIEAGYRPERVPRG